MDTYLYKYVCPRWWGNITGLGNINSNAADKDTEVIEKATKYENWTNGSKGCNIALLQKYKVSITNIKNYSALTSIPMNISVNSKFDTEPVIIKPKQRKVVK